MGQPVTVVKKPSSNAGVVRFEINRSITGMGHERYGGAPGPELDRPCDELARRLFAHHGVQYVHVNSNVITVNMAFGADDSALGETIGHLFTHYGPMGKESAPAISAESRSDSSPAVGPIAPVVQTMGSRPKNFRAMAIVSVFVGALIPGIIAVVYSTLVNSRWDSGDPVGAHKASGRTKGWAIASFCLGALGLVILLAVAGS